MAQTATLDDKLRLVFKNGVNRFMLAMWRMGMGKYVNFLPRLSGRIMVITHTGRKSGTEYKAPVNYAELDGDLYCVAGFGRVSDWYRNIIANPALQVWLPDGWWEGAAEEIEDMTLKMPLVRLVLQNSGFAAYAAGIDPFRITDEELLEKAGHYALIRIRRTAARTGKGGPGEYAWIWPGIVIVLFPLLFRKRRR